MYWRTAINGTHTAVVFKWMKNLKVVCFLCELHYASGSGFTAVVTWGWTRVTQCHYPYLSEIGIFKISALQMDKGLSGWRHRGNFWGPEGNWGFDIFCMLPQPAVLTSNPPPGTAVSSSSWFSLITWTSSAHWLVLSWRRHFSAFPCFLLSLIYSFFFLSS